MGLLLVLTVGISYLAISNLSKGNDRVEELYLRDMEGVMQANHVAEARGLNGLYARDAMLNISKPEAVATDERQSNDQMAKMQSSVEAMEKLFVTAEGKEAVSVMRNTLPAYEAGYMTSTCGLRLRISPAPRPA